MRQMTRPNEHRLRTERQPLSLPRTVREISERVKVIRFGVVRKATESPWNRLAGMFATSGPVRIEEMLHARGDEETAETL